MKTWTNGKSPARILAGWLAFAAAAAHGTPETGTAAAEINLGTAPQQAEARLRSLVPVESIPAFGRLHSWSVVDDDRLIIWATPFRPYLVELFRPSPELKFAVSIGVTSFGSRIHAKFDSVEVDGFSYPIRRIYEMSRDDAKALKATT